MRPALLDPLFAPAETLPGVGPKNAKLIDKLTDRPQGARVVDVLFHLPYAVIDRRARPKIAEAERGFRRGFRRARIPATAYQFPLPAVAERARFGPRAGSLAARVLAPKRLIIHVRRIVLSASFRRSNVSRGGPRGRADKCAGSLHMGHVDGCRFVHCLLGGARRERNSKSRMREAHRLRRRPHRAIGRTPVLANGLWGRP